MENGGGDRCDDCDIQSSDNIPQNIRDELPEGALITLSGRTTDVPGQQDLVATEELFSALSEITSELSADVLSARLEKERRLLAADPEYVPQFVASDLADILVGLAVAKRLVVESDYEQQEKWVQSIQQFGRVVEVSAPGFTGARYTNADELFELLDDEDEFVNPIAIVRGYQRVRLKVTTPTVFESAEE